MRLTSMWIGAEIEKARKTGEKASGLMVRALGTAPKTLPSPRYGVVVGQRASERLHTYRACGTQAHVCKQQVVRERISAWYNWYGAAVLDWYQDRCWKFGTTIVSGMSSVVLSGLIQHLELVACLSAEASIHRYSPPTGLQYIDGIQHT